MPRKDTARDAARQELMRAIVQMGYPEEFGVVLAGELRGEGSMRRMTSYLRQVGFASPEDIADEMLAITQMRDAWAERKMSEHANASYTRFLNRPREDE